jgi:hypothetical protein
MLSMVACERAAISGDSYLNHTSLSYNRAVRLHHDCVSGLPVNCEPLIPASTEMLRQAITLKLHSHVRPRNQHQLGLQIPTKQIQLDSPSNQQQIINSTQFY